MQIVINCLYCNKSFLREKSAVEKNQRNGSKNFCSRSCSTKYYNTGKVVTQVTKDKIRANLKNKPKKQQQLFSCQFCGKGFIRQRKSRVYCSVECYINSSGKNTVDTISTRTLQKILRRAFPNWKCPYCDWSATFDIHHINPRKYGVNNSFDNLVLLCPNHHSLITRNIQQFEDLEDHAVGKHLTQENWKSFYFGKNNYKF